jgi:hypothetical protein
MKWTHPTSQTASREPRWKWVIHLNEMGVMARVRHCVNTGLALRIEKFREQTQQLRNRAPSLVLLCPTLSLYSEIHSPGSPRWVSSLYSFTLFYGCLHFIFYSMGVFTLFSKLLHFIHFISPAVELGGQFGSLPRVQRPQPITFGSGKPSAAARACTRGSSAMYSLPKKLPSNHGYQEFRMSSALASQCRAASRSPNSM